MTALKPAKSVALMFTDKKPRTSPEGYLYLRDVPLPASGKVLYWDSIVPGFGLRITASGTKAFVLDYRVRGSGVQRRFTIGRYMPGEPEGWTLKAARAEAAALRKRIDKGEDPMGSLHAERAAETIADLAKLFKAEHVARRRESTQRDYLRQIDKDIVPRLGRMKVTAVTRADIDRLHREVSKRAPVQANRVIAVASAMFSHAVKRGWRADNPASRIERNLEENRERFLSQAEIVALAEALAAYPAQDSADCIRFLLLTGARRGEAMTARWADINLETGVWTKPSAHTKAKRVHRVPLSAPALELLAKRRETADEAAKKGEASEWVFPGRDPKKPIAQIRACWYASCRRAGIKGVRIHDLRHTHASILASAGVSLVLVGALLGHTQPRTTARYAHLYDDPLRKATEHVGAFVKNAGKPGKVVPLRKDGAA